MESQRSTKQGNRCIESCRLSRGLHLNRNSFVHHAMYACMLACVAFFRFGDDATRPTIVTLKARADAVILIPAALNHVGYQEVCI